jgi:hypothetical protein
VAALANWREMAIEEAENIIENKAIENGEI